MANLFTDALAALSQPVPALTYGASLPTGQMPNYGYLNAPAFTEPSGGERGPSDRGPTTSGETVAQGFSEMANERGGLGRQMAADLMAAAPNMMGAWGVVNASGPLGVLGAIGKMGKMGELGAALQGAMAYGGWAGVLDASMRDAALSTARSFSGFSPATLDAVAAAYGDLKNALGQTMGWNMDNPQPEPGFDWGWSGLAGVTGPGVAGAANSGWGSATFGSTNDRSGGLAGVGQAPGDQGRAGDPQI